MSSTDCFKNSDFQEVVFFLKNFVPLKREFWKLFQTFFQSPRIETIVFFLLMLIVTPRQHFYHKKLKIFMHFWILGQMDKHQKVKECLLVNSYPVACTLNTGKS
jgi:hypothetical protein